MHYSEHAPCAELDARVACYWTLRGLAPLSGAARPHLVLPDGCVDIVWSFGDPMRAPGSSRRPGAGGALVGPMTRALAVIPSGRTELFGVRFRPGEASALFPVAPQELRDLSVDLALVWHADARDLGDRLAEAASTDARIEIIDRELSLRASRARPVDLRVRRAVRLLEAIAAPGARTDALAPRPRVASLAARVGLGERQLERAFAARLGFGPKALSRALRLQALAAPLASAAASARPGHARAFRVRGQWSGLAADLGYADQAHLVREVRDLAGVTPTELARSRGWLDVPEASGALFPGRTRDVGFVQSVGPRTA